MQDADMILAMQVVAFAPLLDKYRDYDTNPAAETIERIRERMAHPLISSYFIQLGAQPIGHIRIYAPNDAACRLSQMFILPAYQGHGYAQQAIAQAELLYPHAREWTLDTIKQEEKLCHLYEKMGYMLTGEEKHIKDGMDLVDYRKQK